jgi:hypothetical protein
VPPVRASLAIIAALGVTLALVNSGGRGARSAGAEPAVTAAESGLEPEVALRAATADPARTLPRAVRELAIAAPSLDLPRDVRRWSASLRRSGIGSVRGLLGPVAWIAITVESSCPPPALLACRPAVRAVARLRGGAFAGVRRDVRIATLAGLRTAGFQRLTVRTATGGDAGRVTSRGETLAAWRLTGRTLQVATGGLELAAPVPRGHGQEPIEVEVDRALLDQLVAEP